MIKRFLAAAFLLVAPAALADGVKAPEISLDELKAAVAAKSVTIVDANGTGMYTEGHIPGAVNIDWNAADFASKARICSAVYAEPLSLSH